MRDLFRDYKTDGPALILGKGPSFREPTSVEKHHFITIGLNHVCRETKVDVAHIIDIDVINQLGDKLYDNAHFLFMPYHPHAGWRPHPTVRLADLCTSHTIISKMASEGRVFGYNLSTIKATVGDSPVVNAKYYSAEAAVDLLAKLGVKQIRTLGIDGGNQQSPSFNDLTHYNKERGYDLQWKGIRKSIATYHLDYAPLGTESPIRIFIGAGVQQTVPALVLKHSILKYVTMSVDVIIMSDWKHPMPKDPRNYPRTPFSFQRFMIPEKCGYKGHAIYMDSDMLVFGDVKDIWTLKSDSDIVAMRNDDVDKHRAKYAVVWFNCARSIFDIKSLVSALDDGSLSYDDLVFNFAPAMNIQDGWNPRWNDLENYEEGKTKLLHLTEMYNQPWLANPNHPLGHLWFSELKEAVADGSIDINLIEDHVIKGWILPKCLEVVHAHA